MSRLDFPLTWTIGSRELILNNHRTVDGGEDRAQLANRYEVEAYDFSPLDIREQREGYHLLTGGDFGPANRQFRHLNIRGVIVAESAPRLDDMEAELLGAFDLEHAQLDSPDDYGIGTLKHISETAISEVGLGAKVVEGFYCRPENYPVTYDRRGPRSRSRAFILQLAAGYPYRCLFPMTEIELSASEGWSAELQNWSAFVGGISRLKLVVVHDAAGASNFTVSDGTRSLVLDLSGFGAGTLYIEMWSKQLYNSLGVSKANSRTSDIDSFFDVPPGGMTLSVANTTNVTSVTAQYHQTRA